MNKIISSVALGFGLASSAVVAHAQNVFVTNYYTNTVAGFSTTSGAPVVTFSGGDATSAISFPIGIATNPTTGNLFVTSINTTTATSSILRLGTDGVHTAVFSPMPQNSSTLYNPKGVVFAGNTLYVSNGGPGATSPNNSYVGLANVVTGSYSNYNGGAGSPINAPYGIAYDGSRYLYVNNAPAGGPNGSATSTTAISRIDTLNPGSPAVNLTLQSGMGAPTINYTFNGLAFGPDGALYVTDASRGNVLRITAPNLATSTINLFTSGLIGLEGLAFDPLTNNLYFASDDDTVRRIVPLGNVATGYTQGVVDPTFTIQEADNSGPTFLAFSPIPEPSTYAIFGVAGTVLLGFGLRRRQQVSLRA